MVDGFGLAVPPRSVNAPALTSNHITGQAIDMDITWSGTSRQKPAQIAVPFMSNVNANRRCMRRRLVPRAETGQ